MHCNNAKQLSVLWGSFSICFSIFHFFCSFVKDVMRFDVNSGARVSTVNNSFGVCIVCNKHSSLRKRKIDFDWSPFTRRLVLLLFYVLCFMFYTLRFEIYLPDLFQMDRTFTISQQAFDQSPILIIIFVCMLVFQAIQSDCKALWIQNLFNYTRSKNKREEEQKCKSLFW